MKGSQWGSREVRNRVADGKVEVLGKLMREGLDEKLDLWLETGHFQTFPIDRFLPDKPLHSRPPARATIPNRADSQDSTLAIFATSGHSGQRADDLWRCGNAGSIIH